MTEKKETVKKEVKTEAYEPRLRSYYKTKVLPALLKEMKIKTDIVGKINKN